MLVLTRRVGESLLIDHTIRVTVLAINGNKVRLGFEAPASVTVLRGEVLQRQAPQRVEVEGRGPAEAAGGESI